MIARNSNFVYVIYITEQIQFSNRIECLHNAILYKNLNEINTEYIRISISLNERKSGTTQNGPLWVKTTTDVKNIKIINNNKKRNRIRVNNFKVITKYYSCVLVESTFSFAHF